MLGNFALLDQIGALSWLSDNAGAFGGDRGRVTLVGHDTGAACITYLLNSPVMPPSQFLLSIVAYLLNSPVMPPSQFLLSIVVYILLYIYLLNSPVMPPSQFLLSIVMYILLYTYLLNSPVMPPSQFCYLPDCIRYGRVCQLL